MGWFLDIFVEYLFRVVHRALKRRGTRDWAIMKATVLDSSYPRAAFGCHVAGIGYQYRVDGELYTGISEKPLIALTMARVTLATSSREQNSQFE